MSEQGKSGDSIHATISGPVSGQVAVGAHNTQVQTLKPARAEETEAELAELRRLLGELCADLRVRVRAEAPPEKKDAAEERVKELKEAVTAPEPDLTTMAYVKQWFVRNVPTLAGSVTSVVIHSIVGKLVGAAGEVLAAEFRRRFVG
jgi:hypothetical protein